MKKMIVLAASAALLTCVSVSSFAATKSLEARCKAQAEKHKVSQDKMDAYIKTCVVKHMKHMKRVKHKKHVKKTEAKADAPAPAAASTPAASGK
jgi:hypothetical protein